MQVINLTNDEWKSIKIGEVYYNRYLATSKRAASKSTLAQVFFYDTQLQEEAVGLVLEK